MTVHVIHIEWEGPFLLEQLGELTNTTRDYGVYQIYGSHPVYGNSVLLYIGQANRQTFGVRIRQELWQLNSDARSVQVYIGRLAGEHAPTLEEWGVNINLAEKLLIYAHAPASNSQYVNSIPESTLRDIHILNWGTHKNLLPEVSGARWTRKYYDLSYYEVYDTTKLSTPVR